MRIEPKGVLLQWLEHAGKTDLLESFEVDDDRLERFKEEADAQRHLSEEERQALAVYMAITHPGWNKARLQKEFGAVDAKAEEAPPVAAAKSASFNFDLLWKVIVLLLLGVIALRAQVPHDPIFIRGINTAGTNLFTRGAGLVEIHCGANLTCSFSNNRLSMIATAGGASVNWGAVGGTLSSQLDLVDALALKADATSKAGLSACGAGQFAVETVIGGVVCAQVPYASLSGLPTLRYQTIEYEGSGLTQRATVNFSGPGVECTDNAGTGKTDCVITGGGGPPVGGSTWDTLGATTWNDI